MSLDVYLSHSEDKLKDWEKRKEASIKEAGSMIGLIPLIEQYYEDRKPDPLDYIYSANITHNLGAMAGEAGIYGCLWHPESLNIEKAKDLIDPLKEGLSKLKAKPEYFKTFEPKNGWGKYKDFVKFVENYLNACIHNPESIITVSI